MTSTLTNYNFNNVHDKKVELVERLIKEDKITLTEGLLLLEKEIEYLQAPAPFQPYPLQPYYTTCTNTAGDVSSVTYAKTLHTLTKN